MPGRGRDGNIIQLDPNSFLGKVKSQYDAFKETWFGPLTPPTPVAPDGSIEGRGFDYQTGWNLRRPPRTEEKMIATVEELRNMSRGAETVRIAIETRKDTLATAKWDIRPKANFGETEFDAKERGKGDARVGQLIDFLRYPDKEHDFATWLRLLAEDALVLDAATIYRRRNKGGGVYSLEVVDGGTITRYLDAAARTPRPPAPAYGQWIHGAPYKNYTTDDLLYYPRNPSSHRVYGFSPVEQIILHSNIVLNRNISQLAQYTVSNIPMLFLKAPADWKPGDIKVFQEWFDSILSGNIEERSKAILIPDGADPLAPNKEALMDQADEWFARLVCWAFGIAPNFLIKQMNRASAENYWQQADEEGLIPWLQYFKTMMDMVIVKWFEMPDLEFVWNWERKPQPLTQAQIHQIYLQNKVLTPDEVREELGYDPLTDEQKKELNPSPPPGMAPGFGKPGLPSKPQQKQIVGTVEKTDHPKRFGY